MWQAAIGLAMCSGGQATQDLRKYSAKNSSRPFPHDANDTILVCAGAKRLLGRRAMVRKQQSAAATSRNTECMVQRNSARVPRGTLTFTSTWC